MKSRKNYSIQGRKDKGEVLRLNELAVLKGKDECACHAVRGRGSGII